MLPKPRINEITELREYLGILYSRDTQMNDYYSVNNQQSNCIAIPDSCHTPGLPAKRFQCEVCQEKFVSRQGLNQHIGRMHSVFENAVACPICNASFKHKHAMQFHIRQVHEKSTRVTCQVCGKVCYNKQVALRHLRMKHDII